MNLLEMASTIIAVWNIIVFFLYGLDKHKAKRGTWRVSEKALLLSAAFMGGIGALAGMYFFRHKTKHLNFKVGVPLLLLFNIAVGAAVIFLFDFPFA